MTPMGRRWLVALLIVLLLLPLVIPTFFVLLLIEIAILALFATAFNLLMGFGGMVSFGHAAYFALGAYTAALLAKKAGVAMLLALAAAPLVAAAGALFFGVFIVRLTATYFAMLSLACGQIVFTIIFKWTSLTGGDNGLLNVWPPPLLKAPADRAPAQPTSRSTAAGSTRRRNRTTSAPEGRSSAAQFRSSSIQRIRLDRRAARYVASFRAT
jgi:branched-chain amino acid transport system permease protein